MNQQRGQVEDIIKQIQCGEKKMLFAQKRPTTYKSYCSVLVISVMYYLSFVYFGYTFAHFGAIDFKIIVDVYKISLPRQTAHGVYSGIPAFGACIGAFLSHMILKKLSRNKSFILVNGIALIAGFIILIPDMLILLIGRLVQGICVGFFTCITPLTIKEFAPIEILGVMGGLNNIAVSLGVLLGYASGSIATIFLVNPKIQCLFVFSASLLLIIIQLIWVILIFPYETPKYLLLNKRINEAKQIITQIYKPQYQQLILKQKMMQSSLMISYEYNHQMLNNNQKVNKTTPNQPVNYFGVMSCVFLMILQQMTGFIIFTIYTRQFAHTYLPSLQKSFPVIIFTLKLLMSFFATFILFNKVGRKKIIIFGTLIISLSIYSFVYGVYKVKFKESNGDLFILFGLVSFMVIFIASLGPLSYLYSTEVLPPHIYPYVICLKWIFEFVIITLFPILREHSKDKTGVQIFVFFFLFTFVGFIILPYVMVETKDKNEIQIRVQFQEKQKKFINFFVKCKCLGTPEYRINEHFNRDKITDLF